MDGSASRSSYVPMVMKTTLFLETEAALRLPALAKVPPMFLATEPPSEAMSAACDPACSCAFVMCVIGQGEPRAR